MRLHHHVPQLVYKAPRPTKDREGKTLDYFRGLTKGTPALKTFKKYWDALPDLSFSPSDHSSILIQVSKALASMTDETRRIEIRDYVHRHFDAWAVNLKTSMSHNDAVGIDSALSGCHNFRIHPGNDILVLAEEKMFGRHASTSARDIAIRFNLFARLGYTPDDQTLEKAVNVLLDPKTDVPVNEFTNIIWTSAMFEALVGESIPATQELYHELTQYYSRANILSTFNKMSKIGRSILGNLRNADLWFSGHDHGTPALIEGQTKSKPEEKTARLLSCFNSHVLPRSTARLPIVSRQPDLGYRACGTNIFTEIDGPPHFLWDAQNNKNVYEGTTRFNLALGLRILPKHTFLHIPTHDLKAALDQQGPESTAQNILYLLNTIGRQYQMDKKGRAYLLCHEPGSTMYVREFKP